MVNAKQLLEYCDRFLQEPANRKLRQLRQKHSSICADYHIKVRDYQRAKCFLEEALSLSDDNDLSQSQGELYLKQSQVFHFLNE